MFYFVPFHSFQARGLSYNSLHTELMNLSSQSKTRSRPFDFKEKETLILLEEKCVSKLDVGLEINFFFSRLFIFCLAFVCFTFNLIVVGGTQIISINK